METKWPRSSEWPVSATKRMGISLQGRSVLCLLFPAKMLMLKVTGEDNFPVLELGEQHLVPALPLTVCDSRQVDGSSGASVSCIKPGLMIPTWQSM